MDYYPGEFFQMEQGVRKRSIILRLKGVGVLVSITPVKASYNMIDYCFGATNVWVHTSPSVVLRLKDWVDAWEKYGDFDKAIGFSGPNGSDLYIVFNATILK